MSLIQHTDTAESVGSPHVVPDLSKSLKTSSIYTSRADFCVLRVSNRDTTGLENCFRQDRFSHSIMAAESRRKVSRRVSVELQTV